VRDERYAYRPVALCSVIAAGGLLLLLAGLRQIMALRGWRFMLGLALLVAAGLMFVGVYLLGQCAEILDAEGIRIREMNGSWRQMRWEDAVDVSVKEGPKRGRSGGGYALLVVTTRTGEAFEVIRNERTLAMVRRYCPEAIVNPNE